MPQLELGNELKTNWNQICSNASVLKIFPLNKQSLLTLFKVLTTVLDAKYFIEDIPPL